MEGSGADNQPIADFFSSIGLSEKATIKITAILDEEMIETVRDLRSLSEAQFSELKIPMGPLNKIKDALGSIEQSQ